MNDLISRAAAIAAFDDERVDRNYGDVSPESVIRVIESIPAVGAVPVVWLRAFCADDIAEDQRETIEWMLKVWEREQEARST